MEVDGSLYGSLWKSQGKFEASGSRWKSVEVAGSLRKVWKFMMEAREVREAGGHFMKFLRKLLEVDETLGSGWKYVGVLGCKRNPAAYTGGFGGARRS